MNGDSTFKVYGNAGRYCAAADRTPSRPRRRPRCSPEQFYTYTGVDPVTGAPTGRPTPDCGSAPYLNNEFGVAKDPRTIADNNLKPMYQDEYILGFQAQLTDNWSVGVARHLS